MPSMQNKDSTCRIKANISSSKQKDRHMFAKLCRKIMP